jgi:zinc protease
MHNKNMQFAVRDLQKTRWRAAWLFVGMLAALVLPSGFAYAGPKIQHWVASTGAKVFFVETHALPIVDVQVDFPAGGVYATKEKAGVAGLTASLLDQGAGGIDENAIAEKFADLGAQLGNGATMERASVSLRSLSDRQMLDPALALTATVMAVPDYPPAVVEREKERSIAGLKDALTRPDTLASRAFTSEVYRGHPYSILPTPESLAAVQREDLVRFHKANYVAKRAVVTLVGDITRADAERIALQLTEKLPKGDGPPPIPPVVVGAGSEARIEHHAQQAHVYMGLPALKRGDPDFFPLMLGNYTLGGGGFVSRLVTEVRDKRGFAYSVYSYFIPGKELGVFQVGLQTKRSQAKEALEVARKVLADFLRSGPTEEELKAAKANLVGGFALQLDSNKKLIGAVANIGFYDLPLDWLDKYQERMTKVTIADVRAAFARAVHEDKLHTVLVATD